MWICTGWSVPHAAQIVALSLDSSFERQCKSEKDMECSDLEPASERACRIADSIMTNTRMYLSRKTRQCNTTIAQSALCAVAAALVAFAYAAGAGWGQSSQQGSVTRATQFPLSGHQQGGASVQQSATPSTASSVNTLNTQVSNHVQHRHCCGGRQCKSYHLLFRKRIRNRLATQRSRTMYGRIQKSVLRMSDRRSFRVRSAKYSIRHNRG
jgi:hypothetical protein